MQPPFGHSVQSLIPWHGPLIDPKPSFSSYIPLRIDIPNKVLQSPGGPVQLARHEGGGADERVGHL